MSPSQCVIGVNVLQTRYNIITRKMAYQKACIWKESFYIEDYNIPFIIPLSLRLIVTFIFFFNPIKFLPLLSGENLQRSHICYSRNGLILLISRRATANYHLKINNVNRSLASFVPFKFWNQMQHIKISDKAESLTRWINR